MEMVLATDMKQHFALVAKFKTLMTHTHATGSSGVAPVSSHVATNVATSQIPLCVDLAFKHESDEGMKETVAL